MSRCDADPLTLLDPRVAERVRGMERRIAALEAALQNARSPGEVTARPPAADASAPDLASPPPATAVPGDARGGEPRRAGATLPARYVAPVPPRRQAPLRGPML